MFELGKVVTTPAVRNRMSEEPLFSWFVLSALTRYQEKNWGDTCIEDSAANNLAVENGGRILAVYHYNEETPVWIITEADRSITTVLMPYEY